MVFLKIIIFINVLSLYSNELKSNDLTVMRVRLPPSVPGSLGAEREPRESKPFRNSRSKSGARNHRNLPADTLGLFSKGAVQPFDTAA